MNVGELIEQLNALSPDTKVVVRAYEDGFNEIIELKKRSIIHTPHSEWYYGEYTSSEAPNSIYAIELYGENRNTNNK